MCSACARRLSSLRFLALGALVINLVAGCAAVEHAREARPSRDVDPPRAQPPRDAGPDGAGLDGVEPDGAAPDGGDPDG